MPYNSILKLFLIVSICSSFSITSSFSLTEAVDLFGQNNSVDLVLNDIWIEPENPKNGEPITVWSSVYNAGIISTEQVSDAVTIGYFVNDELVEISLLENILPGVENGIAISSGPIFDAYPGNYEVTTIINYHDTLSHLRDSPQNNIVQKIFQIGTEIPSVINFEIFQYYDDKTKMQQVTIQGELTDIFQEGLQNKEIIVDIEGNVQEKISTNLDGEFLLKTDTPFKNEPIKVSVFSEGDSVLHSSSKKIFPIKIDEGQSVLALETISDISQNIDSVLTIAIFQDSYDNLFKKISTEDRNEENLMTDNFFLTVLPANHEYIVEIYIEGRILDAFQNYFSSNTIIKKEIFISESAQVQFKIINDAGEPQNNATVNNWVYSGSSNEEGLTEWMEILPTFTANEPYVTKATFPNGEIVWSEPFLIETEEKKVIQIIQGGNK